MVQFGLPLLYAVFVWWAATGCILYLDGLPRSTFRASLAGATLVLAGALAGLGATATQATPAGAFCAFSCAILVWAWMELSFLTGAVTGPRRTACATGCQGHRHVGHAIGAILYHELAIIAGAVAIAAVTWDGANQIGLATFLVLWIMRTSAKLNLFLGVRNLGEAFLPDHLVYLGSFLRRRRMNPLFPVSIVLGTVVTVLIAQRATAADATPFHVTGSTLVAGLLGLAVIEHWFMMLPLPSEALWSWSFRSRTDSTARRAV